MAEEKFTWSFGKIAGGFGIAFATAFFALTINFVSGVRSELATLKATMEERTKWADQEINNIRTWVTENRELGTRSIVLVEKLEKRVDLLVTQIIKITPQIGVIDDDR